jgi:hypothetical protein
MKIGQSWIYTSILGETVLMAVYGYDAASVDDSLFSTVDTAVRSVSEALVVQSKDASASIFLIKTLINL